MTDFSNLNDSLDDMLDAPARVDRRAPPVTYTKPETYFDRCGKCGNSGQTRWGVCFRCKGKGGKTFKTSPADRAKARQDRTERKQRTAEEARAAMKAEHPEVYAWLLANVEKFEFATSMWNALRTYEALTPNQLAACERCVAPDKQRAAERVADAKARLEDAPSIDISKIETAFTAALENLLKFPKLRLDTFEFSRASAASKNAGALYVKEGETYLGKIQGGKLICTRQCDDKTKARVIEAAADPHKAAKAYGMRTGSCSCCGRELTNGESIDLGIGPICAGKYGWGGRRAFSPDGGSHA